MEDEFVNNFFFQDSFKWKISLDREYLSNCVSLFSTSRRRRRFRRMIKRVYGIKIIDIVYPMVNWSEYPIVLDFSWARNSRADDEMMRDIYRGQVSKRGGHGERGHRGGSIPKW